MDLAIDYKIDIIGFITTYIIVTFPQVSFNANSLFYQ